MPLVLFRMFTVSHASIPFSATILQESQNGITHFSEYVEIILRFILDLNAQNDRVKTKSIIPTDSASLFIVLIKLY